MGLWSGIKDADTFERGKYMQPGFHGLVRVRRTMAKETRKSGVAFIVELEVITTNMPDKHPEGSKGTWFQKMTDKAVAFPAIKAFASACAGIPVHDKETIKREIDPHLEAIMDAATENEEDNDFIGVTLILDTEQIKTQKNQDFTRYDFSPYTE